VDRGELQAFSSGGDDGAEVLPSGCAATAAGFDEAGQESEGTGPLFRACAVADVARNHPVPQRLFRSVVGKRQVGLGD